MVISRFLATKNLLQAPEICNEGTLTEGQLPLSTPWFRAHVTAVVGVVAKRLICNLQNPEFRSHICYELTSGFKQAAPSTSIYKDNNSYLSCCSDYSKLCMWCGVACTTWLGKPVYQWLPVMIAICSHHLNTICREAMGEQRGGGYLLSCPAHGLLVAAVENRIQTLMEHWSDPPGPDLSPKWPFLCKS